MAKPVRWILFVCVALVALGGIGWGVWARIVADGGPATRPDTEPAPVEVVPVVLGAITERRTFSGTLTSPAEIHVAARIGGRIERLHVDLADEVEQGQVVAELDSAEFQQAVALADAELAVARANESEAVSALEIAGRELQRVKTLQDRGVVSDAQFDTAAAEELAARSRVEVARARCSRRKRHSKRPEFASATRS